MSILVSFVETLIRKTKNPSFRFQSDISNSDLVSFVLPYFFGLIRGLYLVPFRRYNKMLVLKRGVKFRNLRNIAFGKNVIIEEFSFISSFGKQKVVISDNVRIGPFSRITTTMGLNNLGEGVLIGDNVSLGEYCSLGGAGGLEIGSDTIIGSYFSTHPENHNFGDPNVLIRKQGVNRKGIKVGSNCWIGAKVTLLDGVKVGNGSIIAAGAVVTKEFGENLIIGGVPAKVLRHRFAT